MVSLILGFQYIYVLTRLYLLDIISITISDLAYNFRLVFFIFSIRFYSHQFRLVSALFILCFNSSTLYLFNSSACYKQTSMLI